MIVLERLISEILKDKLLNDGSWNKVVVLIIGKYINNTIDTIVITNSNIHIFTEINGWYTIGW